MPEEDNKPAMPAPSPLSPPPSWVGERVRSIDKKALAAAAGLMMLSWGALPIVYWLIVRKKKEKRRKNNG